MSPKYELIYNLVNGNWKAIPLTYIYWTFAKYYLQDYRSTAFGYNSLAEQQAFKLAKLLYIQPSSTSECFFYEFPISLDLCVFENPILTF